MSQPASGIERFLARSAMYCRLLELYGEDMPYRDLHELAELLDLESDADSRHRD